MALNKIKWFIEDLMDGSIWNWFKVVRMWKSLTYKSGNTWYYYDCYGLRFWVDSWDSITYSSKYPSSKMEKYGN